MRPFAFWDNPPSAPGMIARLLQPLGRLYAAGTAARIRRTSAWTPPVPVICVGNLNVGGTGKTPTVIALCERLSTLGHVVHIVSRGYGGTLVGPVRVDPARHTAAEVGDEPLLLAAFAPVWIARDRRAGVAVAAAGATVIVMDDGFQDPSVAKSLSIVAVDASRGFGNGLCLPAGPLREPVGVGLTRADLLLTIGPPSEQAKFGSLWDVPGKLPRLEGALVPLKTGMDWQGLRSVAFAGIGNPEKFFSTLRGLGADIVRAEALDDHQAFSAALLMRLETEAAALSAQLVTTEKDAVRLPEDFRRKVVVLPVRLEISDWSAIDAELARIGLAAPAPGGSEAR